ncbi:FAD-binding oxidoreductase [Corynebacterium camporealensis]
MNEGIKKILSKLLGASADQINKVDDADIQLSEVRLSEDDLNALGNIVGSEQVSTDREQRIRRARGKSYFDLLDWRSEATIDAPDAIVAPRSEDEVLKLLQWCTENNVAVVPFGGGTSVVGGLNPNDGGLRAVITLDLIHFQDVEDVDTVSKKATLGAGLPGPQAELMLAEYGLQIGHYPQSFPYASIGGYAATRSSGQSSAGYGRFDEMVTQVTVVTPQGITTLGHGAPKTAAGPDLRQLFLGSEGTLGVITRVRVRLHDIPQNKRYEAFQFPDFETGATAMREVYQQGTGPTVMRMSDEIETATNLTSADKIGEAGSTDAGCLMLTMYEGTPEHTKSRHEETRNLLLKMGGKSLGEDPVRSWEQGRFGAPVFRDGLLDNGAICETLETATTWSKAAELKAGITQAIGDALAESGTPSLIMCHISHVYETGCSLYFTILAGQREDAARQWWKAKEAASKVIVEQNGSITHHHAVGTDHKPFLPAEFSDLGIDILRAVKKHLDPAGILNPGKLF